VLSAVFGRMPAQIRACPQIPPQILRILPVVEFVSSNSCSNWGLSPNRKVSRTDLELVRVQDLMCPGLIPSRIDHARILPVLNYSELLP